jgi:hypothetical protein
VIFARQNAAGAAPLQAPLLVLLVDGYTLGPGVAQAVDSARQAGFRPFVVPWFALSLGVDAMIAVAGFEALADGVRRAIAGPEALRPDAIAVLADPPSLGRVARQAIDGLLHGSGAPVIAPLLDDAAVAPVRTPLGAVLSFAPPHARILPLDGGTHDGGTHDEGGDENGGDDEWEARCAMLARGVLLPVLHASGDPARLLLAARLRDGHARFGFIDAGTGVDQALLRAWLAVARARCAPSLPFLLPTPRYLLAAPVEALHRAANGASMVARKSSSAGRPPRRIAQRRDGDSAETSNPRPAAASASAANASSSVSGHASGAASLRR